MAAVLDTEFDIVLLRKFDNMNNIRGIGGKHHLVREVETQVGFITRNGTWSGIITLNLEAHHSIQRFQQGG